MTPLKHWEWPVLSHSKGMVFLFLSYAWKLKFNSRTPKRVSHSAEDALAQPWFLTCSYFMVPKEANFGCPQMWLWCRKAATVQFSGHMWEVLSSHVVHSRCHKHPWINKYLMAHAAPDDWVPGSLPGRTSLHTQKYIHSCFLHSFHCRLRSGAWSCT